VGEIVYRLRSTDRSAVLGVIRIMLGVLFLMTGIMKLVVPMLWEAWSGQLMQGNIPFYTFNLWFVPIAETLIGGLFVRGLFSRVASVVAIPMMLVATYVHLVVKDPSLFPLQPKEPVIPIIVLVMAGIVLWRGGGSWSMDLASSKRFGVKSGH